VGTINHFIKHNLTSTALMYWRDPFIVLMKRTKAIFFLIFITGACYPSGNFNGGLCINTAGGYGNGFRNNIPGTISTFEIGFQYIPVKSKPLIFSVCLQRGQMKTENNYVYQYSCTGIEAVNKPFQNKATRIQPFAGFRISRGRFGERLENDDSRVKEFKNDNRFIVSPVLGLEFFFKPKFSIEGKYKYDFITKVPQIRGSVISTGLKIYLF
jgi:hypothetical protein